MKKSDWNQLRLNLITASCGNSVEAMEIAYYQYQDWYREFYGHESDSAKLALWKFELHTKKKIKRYERFN